MFIFLCHSYAFWQRSNFYLLSAELEFLPCRILIFCFIMSHVTFFGYMGIIVRNNCVCEIIIMGWGRIIILQCRGIIVWLIQHHKKNDTSGAPDSVGAFNQALDSWKRPSPWQWNFKTSWRFRSSSSRQQQLTKPRDEDWEYRRSNFNIALSLPTVKLLFLCYYFLTKHFHHRLHTKYVLRLR